MKRVGREGKECWRVGWQTCGVHGEAFSMGVSMLQFMRSSLGVDGAVVVPWGDVLSVS